MIPSCDAVPGGGDSCASLPNFNDAESGECHVGLATPTLFRSRFRRNLFDPTLL
jgi:hypothetical protein